MPLHWYIVLSISECGNLLFRFENAINLADLPAGWCAECWLGGAWLNSVVYCGIGGGSAIAYRGLTSCISYSVIRVFWWWNWCMKKVSQQFILLPFDVLTSISSVPSWRKVTWPRQISSVTVTLRAHHPAPLRHPKWRIRCHGYVYIRHAWRPSAISHSFRCLR
jgi:hypothetical protein